MTAPISTDVRARLVETLRRNLIGPPPRDADLARERLKEKPSGWYVTGYFGPCRRRVDLLPRDSNWRSSTAHSSASALSMRDSAQ
jgi:hypothetical protein